jgi:uncharacterized protein HemY
LLATCPNLAVRDPERAAQCAKKAAELAPEDNFVWRPLGVARYRQGDWQAAIDALQKAAQLGRGGCCAEFFFLAMAHWQQGDREKARAYYDRAVGYLNEQKPLDEDLNRFRAEAAALLGVAEMKPAETTTGKAEGP